MEIHSKWGTSEYRGNPNPLKEIHPGPSYAQDFLEKGFMLGFIGGTDTHTTMTFARNIEFEHLDKFPGITAVCTSELTRNNIFHGIKNRSCYATSMERIYLDVSINGEGQGKSIKWDNIKDFREIKVAVAAQSNIQTIEIIRNGQCIYKYDTDDWKTDFIFTDKDELTSLEFKSQYIGNFIYYYVRVTCSSGAQAWSSPIWILV